MKHPEDKTQPRILFFMVPFAGAILLAHLCCRLVQFPLPLPWPAEHMFPLPLTGPLPSLSWLWEPIYFHRSPLIKLLVYIWVHLTQWNLYWAAWLTAACYALAAAAVMGGVYRRRRSFHWRDIALLLVLLSPLQMPNIVSMLQLQFVIPYVLFITWFSMLWVQEKPTPFQAALSSMPLVVLGPLCSAFGFILGLAAALWLGAYAVFLQEEPISRRRLAPVAVLGLLTAAYYNVCGTWGAISYEHQFSRYLFESRTGHELTIIDKLLNGLSFFALPFGSSVAKVHGMWLGPVMLAGIGAIAAALFIRILRDRTRAHGPSLVLALLAAEVLAALAIGYGKDAGTHYRYFTLVTPLPIALYMAAEVFQGARARWIAVVATGVLVIGAAGSFRDGYKFQNDRARLHKDLIAWINEGADFARVPEDKTGLRLMFWPSAEVYLGNLDLLQKKRMSYFAEKWMLLGLRELDDLKGWQATPAECMRKSVLDGVTGTWLHTRDCPSDVPVRLESPPFLVEADYVQIRTFGSSTGTLRVELLDGGGGVIGTAMPVMPNRAEYHFLDARAIKGQVARLRLCDDEPGAFMALGSVFASKRPAL